MTSTKTFPGSRTAELLSSTKDESSRNLSRSPHPYHRRSSSLQQPNKSLNLAGPKYSESSDSTGSEERGTEADDEKILKGLPAPPLRGRKGLRGSKTPADSTPAISPFPTPPALSDRRPSYFTAKYFSKSSNLDSGPQERAIEAYNRYVKRRRAEIVRRCTEATLLALIATVVCSNAANSDFFKTLSYELSGSVVVLTFLLALLPLRVALRKLKSGNNPYAALRAGFHVPSVFDPGSFLYPVFLPFLISVSVIPNQPIILLTNIILGLSSLPQRVLPHGQHVMLGQLHWMLTCSPLVAATFFTKPSNQSCSQRYGIEGEEMTLLFPLHQAVLLTLKYLTSTSLDPAEMQLLSAGLINLYLFTNHPQAEILSSLLWTGSICLFVFCQKPLSWEIRIARIPSWKFARNKAPRTGLLSIFEKLLNSALPLNKYAHSKSLESDDEDYDHLKSARKMAKAQIRLRNAKPGGPQSDLDLMLSEKEREIMQTRANGLKRSSTTTANSSQPSFSHRRRKHLHNLPTTGLLSLTYAQAQACKWLISCYVFLAAATIILVVVRHYVSIRALSSHEPFGWAIGYLFGDLQPVRLWVVSNNLDTWIALPGHKVNNVVQTKRGWVELFRQLVTGPANMRLVIACYCVSVLAIGILAVLQLRTMVEVDTRRKVFHGIMVAMLLPMIYIDPCFIALALGLILAVFLLLDLFRASQLPPISKPLTAFLAPYVDGRDYRGPVIVSPIFLLIGCAIPLWLSLAGANRTGDGPWTGWDTDARELGMISGVVCVGMGDAAASLVGRRYGKTKWFWGGGKSIEGSVAFAVAVVVGLGASYSWLRIGGWTTWESRALPAALFKMAVAGSGASILESVLTAGNDNVIVPIGLWLLTRGLQI